MEPFISQIFMFGFNWAPKGFSKCDGQIIAISSNPTLFSLIGNVYGGATFALPDMRGRVPVHMDPSHPLYVRGWKYGLEEITITESTMPNHTHDVMAMNTPPISILSKDYSAQTGLSWAQAKDSNATIISSYGFSTGSSDLVALSIAQVSLAGNGQPHYNVQPIQVINFCIAEEGTYPSRN